MEKIGKVLIGFSLATALCLLIMGFVRENMNWTSIIYTLFYIAVFIVLCYYVYFK